MCPNIVNEGVLGSKDKAEGMSNFVTGCAIGEFDSPSASLSSSLLFQIGLDELSVPSKCGGGGRYNYTCRQFKPGFPGLIQSFQ